MVQQPLPGPDVGAPALPGGFDEEFAGIGAAGIGDGALLPGLAGGVLATFHHRGLRTGHAATTATSRCVIERESGKGFRWAPVSAADFAEVVQIIAALEALAIELTPKEALDSIAPGLLQEAQSVTASMESSSEIDRRDDEFRALLTSGCPSKRLHAIIASLKLALRR